MPCFAVAAARGGEQNGLNQDLLFPSFKLGNNTRRRCYNKCRHIKALSDTERSKNNVGEKTGDMLTNIPILLVKCNLSMRGS